MSSKRPQSRRGPDIPMPCPHRHRPGRERRDPSQAKRGGSRKRPRVAAGWSGGGQATGKRREKAADGQSPVSPSGGDGGARAGPRGSRGLPQGCRHGDITGDKAQLPTRPAPRKPGRGRSERSLSPDSQFPPPHESVLPPGHTSKARFLSCGASGHLRGSTPARCSAEPHLQALYHPPHSTCQGSGLVGSGHGGGGSLEPPTGSPWWGVSRGRRAYTRAQRPGFRREERVCGRPHREPVQSQDEESKFLTPHLTPQAAGTGWLRSRGGGREPGPTRSPAAGQVRVGSH